MELEQNHQVVSLSQTIPFITQTVKISSQGKILGCFVSKSKEIKIMTSQPSEYRYEDDDIQNYYYLRTFNLKGKEINVNELYGNITGFKVVKGHSLIIESITKQMRYNVWFPVQQLGFQDQRIKTGVQRERRMQEIFGKNKVQYWTFPQSSTICVLEREEMQKKLHFSVKLSYFMARHKFALTDIATHGATYYDQKQLVSCFQLDNHSKIGWITQNKEGKSILYMLTLGEGTTEIEKLDVTITSNEGKLHDFWMPIWQLEDFQDSSTYLMAKLRINFQIQEQEDSDQEQFIIQDTNYYICTLVKGQIIPKTKLSFPKIFQKSTILHENAYKIKDGILFFKYNQYQQETINEIRRQGIFDSEKNIFTSLQGNNRIIYQNSRSKNMVFLEKIEPQENIRQNGEQWQVAVTVICTDLKIKDVFMELLLGLNQDLDDDLLCDAIALLTE